MARETMTQEIVECRYPVYDTDLKALIAKIYSAHRGEADIEERLIDAIWQEGYAEFRVANLEASRGNTETLGLAQRGELTPAGRAAIQAYLDEAQAYDESLLELSDIELAARHDEVCGPVHAAQQAERHMRGLKADLLAFFNRTSAAADFARWSNLPVWTAEEAIALSLGKDPKCVNVASLTAYTCLHGSPFRDDFIARLDALERAIKAGNPRAPLTPLVFIKWAAGRHLELPSILTDRFGSKAAYGAGNSDPSYIHSNRLHTYYTIILGLAAKHYGLDVTMLPIDKQPQVYSAIAKDLFEKKAEVNEKTLRAIVREALVWAQHPQQPLVEHAIKQKNTHARARTRQHPRE